MRIGIDCRAYGETHGYIGIYIENLVSYLDKNEDANEYILFFSEREFGDFLPKSSRIRTVKTSVKIDSIVEQIFLPGELYREKLDRMFFSHPNIPFFYNQKVIILLSDLASYFYPEKRLKGGFIRYWNNFILRHSIRKSAIIIALSELLKHDIIEIFDIYEEKIFVIPPMIPDRKDIQPQRQNEIKQFFLKEGVHEKYILSIGELREYKNIPRLLQAYNLFLKESGEDIDLVLVGKEDPAYHEIRSNIIQLGLQNRVHIYSMLDENKIDLLYRNTSIYILPSLYESSPLPILEPLAYGLPIASAFLPSISAIISKNDAIFFRPMSIQDIYEALRKTFSEPLKGYKRDMSLYSVSSVGNKIVKVFSR